VAATNYPHGSPPSDFNNWNQINHWLRQFWAAFNIVRKGKLDCVTTITLTANAASTDLDHPLLAPESAVIFDPVTANAAADLYGGGMYVTTANRGAETWVITHANNANVDRTFRVLIIGG
jgi:hypothetical protein